MILTALAPAAFLCLTVPRKYVKVGDTPHLRRGGRAMDPLQAALRNARLRLALKLALDALGVSLMASVGLACVWLAATRFFPALGDPAPVALGLLAAGLLGAALWTWRHFPTKASSALEIDARLGLRERVTSSLALHDADGPMIAALHRDAREAVARTPVGTAFPLTPSRITKWAWVPMLVFGIAYLALPEFDLFGFRERQAAALVKATKQEEGAKSIEAAAKLLKEGDAAERGTLAEAVEKLELTAADLRSGEISDKQAIAKVSDVLEDLAKQQRALSASKPAQAKGLQSVEHPELKKVLEDLQNGKPQEAAEKLRELQEKMKNGEMSDEEKKKLQEGLQALQKAMQQNGAGQRSDENGESSNKKSGNGKRGGQGEGKSDPSAGDSGENMELSMEDLASSLEQLGKMQQASAKLNQWKSQSLGPSKFCRSCGKALKPCDKPGHCSGTCEGGTCSGHCKEGTCSGAGKKPWSAGESDKQGNGMGGPGKGRGSEVGDLPDDADVDFQPATLPGEQTKGKILTEITERTAPVLDGETSQIEVVQGGFEAVQQQAEEALNQEEIPAGSKELVRQYFGVSEAAPAHAAQ